MKKILAFLKTIGTPIIVKSGKGLFLINPKPFDDKELQALCSSVGIGCIHTTPRHGDETLYVGYVTPRTDEDMLSALQRAKS
tara:strand:- start:268 stop:513 length:246 start_codon:yes stop_codon:yes gene_type:complete